MQHTTNGKESSIPQGAAAADVDAAPVKVSSPVADSSAAAPTAAAAKQPHGRAAARNTAASSVSSHAATAAVAAPAAPPAADQMSTIDRLNYVADFASNNLYDALAALCSWASVSIVAPGQQEHGSQSDEKVREFFESQVLEKLLTIFFSDPSLPLSNRGEVKGALQTLLHHILQLQSDQYGTGYIYYLTEALEELAKEIQQMRRSVVSVPGLQLEPQDAADDATPMGYRVLAKQVAQCLKQLYFQTQDAATASKKAVAGVAAVGSSSSDSDSAAPDCIDAKIDALDQQLSRLYEEAAADARKKHRDSDSSITISNGEEAAAKASMKRLFATRELLHDRLQLMIEVGIQIPCNILSL